MNTAALANMSKDELLAYIDNMQAQPTRKLTCKVSAKGAISVYGLGRFPVTLYASQWDRLLAAADDIRAFAKVNAALLAADRD